MVAVAGLMMIASCKDDEKPRANISFTASEEEVLEGQGIVEVKINLDKPMSETVVLSYTLDGTAQQGSALNSDDEDDYLVESNNGLVLITAGATEAVIEIGIYQDAYEYDEDNEVSYETIIITLNSVLAGPAQIVPTQNIHTLKILEDDLLMYLDWHTGTPGNPGDVDMDMYVSIDNPETTAQDFSIIGGSASVGTEFEAIAFPGHLPSATYGFSYVYYDGTSNNLSFTVTMLSPLSSLNGTQEVLEFNQTYTLDNKNPYDGEGNGTTPFIAQTFKKNGGDYNNVSNISKQATGSRTESSFIQTPSELTRRSLHSAGKIERVKIPKKYLQNLNKK